MFDVHCSWSVSDASCTVSDTVRRGGSNTCAVGMFAVALTCMPALCRHLDKVWFEPQLTKPDACGISGRITSLSR